MDQLEERTPRAQERHHRRDDLATRSHDPQQSRERGFGVLEHIRQWSAVGQDEIERRRLERDDVTDVENPAVDDTMIGTGLGDVVGVQLELDRRDIGDQHLRAPTDELDREPPGPRTDLEHAVARPDEPVEEPSVHFEARPGRGVVDQPLPLVIGVRVEVVADLAVGRRRGSLVRHQRSVAHRRAKGRAISNGSTPAR